MGGPSVGPIYTRTVRACAGRRGGQGDRSAHDGAFVLAWALDGSSDVAGYLVYRANDPSDLVDLRWFGTKPEYPRQCGYPGASFNSQTAYGSRCR